MNRFFLVAIFSFALSFSLFLPQAKAASVWDSVLEGLGITSSNSGAPTSPTSSSDPLVPSASYQYGSGPNPQQYPFYQSGTTPAPDPYYQYNSQDPQNPSGYSFSGGAQGWNPFGGYSAQYIGKSPKNFKELVLLAAEVLWLLNGLIFLLAILLFFWGIVKYVYAAGSEGNTKDAKYIMLYGLFGLFFAVTVGGVVLFLQNTLGL